MALDGRSTHYDAGGIETLNIIRAKLTPEQYKGYLLGTVLAYTCRLNFKGSAERDAEKAATYAQWLAELPADPDAPHSAADDLPPLNDTPRWPDAE